MFGSFYRGRFFEIGTELIAHQALSCLMSGVPEDPVVVWEGLVELAMCLGAMWGFDPSTVGVVSIDPP